MSRIGLWLILICGASLAIGQGLEFEVASVRPSTSPNSIFRGGPGSSDPSHASWTSYTLKNLIFQVYGIPEDQVSAPDWAASDRFDILANVPPGTTNGQFLLMLEELLVRRFSMKIHREKKEVDGYALVVEKGGLKMKESVSSPATTPTSVGGVVDRDGFPVVPPGRPDLAGRRTEGHTRMTGTMQTLPQIVQVLKIELGGVSIADRTGLTGMYDFRLHFATPPSRSALLRRTKAALGDGDVPAVPDRDPAPELGTAVQEQLGLRLERAKQVVDLIIVDRASRVPTEN